LSRNSRPLRLRASVKNTKRSSIPLQDEPDGCLSVERRRRKLIVRNSHAPRVIELADEFGNRVVAVPRHRRNHAMSASATAINR
jgi:hypothetical protein